ncbi:MAG: hydroxylase [Pseudomonadota bacterium]
MDVQYLEIVTTDVDASCATLAEVHAVEFGAPQPEFGNARIALLSNGGRLGVRAPLSADEAAPLVRPYLRIENIEAAIAAAEASGAEFAMLATEIPGHGKFAIYLQGGVQYGLWEV